MGITVRELMIQAMLQAGLTHQQADELVAGRTDWNSVREATGSLAAAVVKEFLLEVKARKLPFSSAGLKSAMEAHVATMEGTGTVPVRAIRLRDDQLCRELPDSPSDSEADRPARAASLGIPGPRGPRPERRRPQTARSHQLLLSLWRKQKASRDVRLALARRLHGTCIVMPEPREILMPPRVWITRRDARRLGFPYSQRFLYEDETHPGRVLIGWNTVEEVMESEGSPHSSVAPGSPVAGPSHGSPTGPQTPEASASPRTSEEEESSPQPERRVGSPPRGYAGV